MSKYLTYNTWHVCYNRQNKVSIYEAERPKDTQKCCCLILCLFYTFKGHDFSEDKLMNMGNLYSLYLLNSDSSSQQLKTSEGLMDTSVASKDKKDSGDTDEEIDVETDGVKDPSPEKVLENGHYDALFEGMPFTELKGKEVGGYFREPKKTELESDFLVNTYSSFLFEAEWFVLSS